MKCVMCKGGELAPGKTTVKVQRGETLVIIKDVPEVEEAVARHMVKFYDMRPES